MLMRAFRRQRKPIGKQAKLLRLFYNLCFWIQQDIYFRLRMDFWCTDMLLLIYQTDT